MTRRTFLRVLGSAVAAGVVAPVIKPFSIPAPVLGPTWDQSTAGAITYEMLERAYKEAVVGKYEPNVLIVSASMARRLGLVYDVDDVAA